MVTSATNQAGAGAASASAGALAGHGSSGTAANTTRAPSGDRATVSPATYSPGGALIDRPLRDTRIALVGRPPTPRCAAPADVVAAPVVPLDAAPAPLDAAPDAEPDVESDDDGVDVGRAAPP